MAKTITVKGVGKVSTRPDQILLTLNTEARDKEYEAAVEQASRQSEALTAAVKSAGFAQEELKTTRFNISTEYESVRDDQGNYRQVFCGYQCSQGFRLAFPLEMSRLGQVLSAIAASNTQPELHISFTVKDPTAIRAALLQSAAANARQSAEVLCAAAGTKLGQLLSIDYNWGEGNVISHTRLEAADCMSKLAAGCFSADMTPEDIENSDSATFIWEMQ